MSKCFIEGMGGGGTGIAKLPAIYVIYPAGSVCTCTNGDKTYKAKDTGGYWLFAGLSIGTWTLTITAGAKKRSVPAEITSAGETVTVKLYYRLWLYDAGNTYADNSGGYTPFFVNYSGGDATTIRSELQAAQIYIRTDWKTRGGVYTKSKIDLTEYNTLYVYGTSAAYVCLSSGTTVSTTLGSCTGSVQAYDISAITGSYNILLEGRTPGNSTATAYIYQIYLE